MFKKFLYLTALMAVMLGGNAMAQSLEPDFEGGVVGVYPDGTTKRLEKQNTRIQDGRQRIRRRLRGEQNQNQGADRGAARPACASAAASPFS